MFSRTDFEQAIATGRLDLGPRYDIQSASVNMPIVELWSMIPRKIITNIEDMFSPLDTPIRDFLAATYELKPLDPATGSWHFKRNEFCLGLVGPIRVEEGVRGACASRSSYARIGQSIRHAEDDFQRGGGFAGFLTVMFTSDTYSVLSPDEQPVQFTLDPWTTEPTIEYVPLTLHEKLLIYDGSTLLSKNDPSTITAAFQPFTLPPQGFDFAATAQDMFFLASTRERVKIPLDRMGYLPERRDQEEKPFSPIRLHSSAPWIMPGDELTITLECCFKTGTFLWPGMPLPDLFYKYLTTPVDAPSNSRYNGQTEATLSR